MNPGSLLKEKVSHCQPQVPDGCNSVPPHQNILALQIPKYGYTIIFAGVLKKKKFKLYLCAMAGFPWVPNISRWR